MNRVANTVMLTDYEYEELKAEAADAASLRKKYADLCMAQTRLPEVAMPTPAYVLSSVQMDYLRSSVRAEAIEECAKIADTYRGVQDCANEIAGGVRALVSPLAGSKP